MSEQPEGQKDHDVAVAVFTAADTAYKEYEEFFLSGDYIETAASQSADPAYLKQQHQAAVQQLKKLLEDRNVRLNEAKAALRQAVQLTSNQWRGPEAKATTLQSGPLKASSRTRRAFDANSLFALARSHGVYDRLFQLEAYDKDGTKHHLVRQEWEIDYQNLHKWLVEQGLVKIIDGAYDEKEETPAVEGAKDLAFIGDVKGK